MQLRKRALLATPQATTDVELKTTHKADTAVAPRSKKVRVTKSQTPSVTTAIEAAEPAQWQEVYRRIKDYRREHVAPVDTMGCERLADPNEEPKVNPTTAAAVRNLQRLGLTIDTIIATPVETIDSCIQKVGFHAKKAQNIKQVALICREQYQGDIPGTLPELVALPGVGPKMAYLTLQCAWKLNLGIGVDVHVDRITHRLGWVTPQAKTPEQTRIQLESWLPKEYWSEINPLLVGFGQILCKGTPQCQDCPVQDLCPSAKFKSKPNK
ncbi:alpha,alpha-trehalase nth1 [Dispira simplex]|nr:alpha,alpha-trehalase nth1 [Dispira simplex]